MSALSQILTGKHGVMTKRTTPRIMTEEKSGGPANYIWPAVTFVLFLAMGPFSAFAVLIALFSLVPNGDDVVEPESLPAK